MAKVLLKKAGVAATQSVLRELMPEIDKRLEALDKRLDVLHADLVRTDAKVDSLGEDMLDRFERQLNLINEINNRMVRLEGKMEGYMEAMRIFQPVKQTSKRRAG